MSSTSKEPAGAERDGTSQAGRALAALDPGYVSVDERTSGDLVEFARAYGKELTYYGSDGEPDGDWSGFVGATLRTEDVAAFLQDPERFTPEAAPELYRPHFVLFLAFLGLLEKSRAEINTLTGRHLDFYYRRVLQMARKPAVPDRVSLVVDLAPGSREALLPGGTGLDAGPDSLGRARSYATDRDLVVNRAQIAQVSSLFVEQRRTGLRQITTQYPNDKPRACEAMFALVLGDPLPPYPGDVEPVDYTKLTNLHAMLGRAESDFYMSLPTLRDLMSRRKERAETPSEWDEIYPALELAGTTKRGAPFTLGRTSYDLEANLQEAVGPFDYGTLPQVSNVYELYEHRARSDVQAFIEETLYFELAAFEEMMLLERRFNAAWGEINRILESAGQKMRSDPTYRLSPADVTAFTDNAMAALGTDGIEEYWEEVLLLEGYFYMPAESFAVAMGEVINTPQNEWTQIYSILEEAHREKLRADRRDEIRRLHVGPPPARFEDLIRHVLGEAPSPEDDPDAIDRLAPYLSEADLAKLEASEAAGDWEEVYNLLEIAERNRLGEPPPEKEEWLNLFPAEDATTVSSRPPADAQGGAPPWVTFGAEQPSSSAGPAPRPVLGWALSSPLLLLGEGQRVITLTLGFSPESPPLEGLFPQGGESPLLFELSTAKGWIECPSVVVQNGSYNELSGTTSADDPLGVRFTVTLGASVDPIAAPPAGLAGMASPWPVLRLMLRPIWSEADGQHVVRYRELSRVLLVSAHVKAEVRGLKAIQLQNDETTLDAKKPFEPFGSAPAVGSRLLIGHGEIAGKRLDSLTFHFQWMGAPPDLLTTYYANYPSAPFAFTARVSWIDRCEETELHARALLFGAEPSAPTSIAVTTAALAAAGATWPEAPSEGSLDEDLSTSGCYLQWELNAPDFQHGSYPAVASSKALALSVAIASNPATVNAAAYQVNPPYTPKLKSLTLDYASSLELRFDGAPPAAGVHRVFHVHPFGASDGETERSSAGLLFLPAYENDGELYLGLRDLSPPQTVSILFQMAEGTAHLDQPPCPIRWSYLSGDRFIPLDGRILSDTTRGLINSGIVELALEPAAPNTRLRGDLYWIRAAVERDTSTFCDTLAVHTQAVSATFVNHDNAPDHFREPLPAGTITRLSAAIPQVAGVRQPYPSYGGRMAEGAATWATRVSERLRHKQRALTMWDYERLVLDRFPEIYRAKCVPATLGEPGRVQVVVIPDVRNMRPSDPFEPRAPAPLLADVQAHLLARAPSSAAISVVNAHYVAVRVRLGVRFRVDGNDAYYTQQLNDDLDRFLSPWAYAEGADLAIGGKIYASSIVDFVERRSYVDFVAGIKLFRSEDGENFEMVSPPADGSGAFVGTTRPDQVLTTARAHEIDVLHDDLYEATLMTGINFMKLELDFFIH